jgi:hypothetical protein
MGNGMFPDHAQAMPIASRVAAMMAGILGGSGTHVVQIIIAIVVAAALIVYFLLRVLARGGRGDISAAAAVVTQHHRAREGAASDATVRLVRAWSGIGIGARSEQWNIAIDGIVVGSIANKETVEVEVAPGHHILRLGSGRHRSVERSFDVAQDEVAGFGCNGPRFWPLLLAALVKPDLWITLRRE